MIFIYILKISFKIFNAMTWLNTKWHQSWRSTLDLRNKRENRFPENDWENRPLYIIRRREIRFQWRRVLSNGRDVDTKYAYRSEWAEGSNILALRLCADRRVIFHSAICFIPLIISDKEHVIGILYLNFYSLSLKHIRHWCSYYYNHLFYRIRLNNGFWFCKTR